MKKQLRNWMLAAAAFLAVGASAQTLETVWSHTTGALGDSDHGRFGTALSGKLIVPQKDQNKLLYWDETNQGVDYIDLGEGANVTDSIGVGINVDDAGNIVLNTQFPNAGSSTDFIILPADGSEKVKLQLTLPSGDGARFDQLGHILGNVLSEEGGYMFIAKNGVGVVDVIKVVNGVQNADYSQAVTTVAFTNNTSTVILPTPGLTVADIDAMMDNDGDISKSFVARQRGSNNSVFYWDADADVSAGMSTLALSSNVEGATTTGASNEGFAAFQLQGKTYYVCPITETGATAERGVMFGVFDETGALVANVPASDNIAGSATVGSISIEANDENSVFIYRYLPTKFAGKYKFSVAGGSVDPDPVAPLYMANDLTGWNYDEPAEFTYDATTGKYTYVLGTAETGAQEFAISTAKGADNWNTGSLVIAENGVIAESGKEYTLAKGIGAIMTGWASQWTITVDLKANTISAVAATEKPAKPLVVDYANPASQSTVESLYQVVLGFQEEISINSEVTAPAMVMTNTGQAIDENCTLMPSKTSAFEAVVSLSKEITEAGIYKVMVMANAIKGNTSGNVNEEIVLAYEVKPASQAVFSFDPADGSTVESLSSIYVDYADGLMISWVGTAEVKDAEGNVVATVKDADVVIPEDKANDFSYIPVRAILPLDKEITAAGTYTLTVPAGYFLTGSNYGNSPELTATYTIEEKAPEVPALYAVGAWQNWDPVNATEFAYNAETGKYTLTMTAAKEFKMSTAKGDWDAEGGFNSGVICVANDQVIAENGKEYPLYVGGNANITFDWESDWTVTVDLKANTISAVAATAKPGQEQPQGPSIETVWKYTENIPGAAGGGDLRFGAALNGKLLVNDKANGKILYWDENNQGADYAAVEGIGVGINVDEAGNIIVNKGFPGATSATDFVIIPADGSEQVALTVTLASGEPARFDQLGRIVGNVMSEEGGYMFIDAAGATAVDIIKIVNGVQDADYSSASAPTGWTGSTSTVVHPIPGMTVAAINEMMDTDGDASKTFVARQRGSNNSVFVWGEGETMESLTLSMGDVTEVTTASATNEGFEVFALQGKTYYVAPLTTDGTLATRGTLFGVFGEDGAIVAHIPAADLIAGGTMQSFNVEPCDENSVYIYQWLPTLIAAKYKFSVAGGSQEEPKALYITGAGFTPEWAPAEPAEFTYEADKDVYTYILDIANSEFKISTTKGETWAEFDAGALQVVGNADMKVNEVYNLEKGSANIKVYDFGTYKLTVSLTNNTIQIENYTGIEGIEAENGAPARYFNLQGVEVANPENGIYIRVQGNKATKVLVK